MTLLAHLPDDALRHRRESISQDIDRLKAQAREIDAELTARRVRKLVDLHARADERDRRQDQERRNPPHWLDEIEDRREDQGNEDTTGGERS